MLLSKLSEIGPADPALVFLKTPNAFFFLLLVSALQTPSKMFSSLIFIISKSSMSLEFTILEF